MFALALLSLVLDLLHHGLMLFFGEDYVGALKSDGRIIAIWVGLEFQVFKLLLYKLFFCLHLHCFLLLFLYLYLVKQLFYFLPLLPHLQIAFLHQHMQPFNDLFRIVRGDHLVADVLYWQGLEVEIDIGVVEHLVEG